MLDLLACSSLVRILSARRLGQGSAVADRGGDRGATAERRGAPLTLPSTVRGCAPRGTGQPGLARCGAGLLVSLGRVLQQIFVECLRRRSPAQCLTWAGVQRESDRSKIVGAVSAQLGAFREVLA